MRAPALLLPGKASCQQSAFSIQPETGLAER
jgi:hypothetical protein